jgi:hypothetical protein
MPLLPRALDESFLGRETRLVGFGRASPDDTSAPSKRFGTGVVDSLDATTFRYRPSPSHACFIDSGGPAFITLDREYVAGVTSSGDLSCTGSGLETRIDPFLRSWVQDEDRAPDAVALSNGCSMSSARASPRGWGLAAVVSLAYGLCTLARRRKAVSAAQRPGLRARRSRATNDGKPPHFID